VLTFLERVNGAPFNATLDQLLARDPTLAQWTNEQKAQLFELWMERGDLARMDSLVQQHRELLSFAWRGVAKQRAAEHDVRGAVELVQRFAAAPVLPQVTTNESIDALQQKVVTNPGDYDAGFALYSKQTQAGRVDDALITLRRITEQPNAPTYFHFLEANAWSARRDWERAWDAWRRFLKL
jgi:thioredoxin-like negative regulator of GroEL